MNDETGEMVTSETRPRAVAGSGEHGNHAESKPERSGPGVVKGRGGKASTQGSSITLEGSGDSSGRDVNNSMSLGDFYGRFVVEREDGEG